MNKRNLCLIALLIAGSLLFVGANAFADNFDKMYMTAANGNTTERTPAVFGYNEAPWLYLKLSEIADSITSAWWTDPNGQKVKTFDAFSANEIFMSPLNWLSIRKIGEWSISAVSHLDDGTVNQGKLKFTVTPEPVSSALFLLGGAALALARLRRSKRNSSV